MLTLPIQSYDNFLGKLPVSREYYILMNCCLDHSQRNMKIPCTMEVAEKLLKVAKSIYPEIAEAIARDIALAQGYEEAVASFKELIPRGEMSQPLFAVRSLFASLKTCAPSTSPCGGV
jgi:hypothetical protein